MITMDCASPSTTSGQSVGDLGVLSNGQQDNIKSQKFQTGKRRFNKSPNNRVFHNEHKVADAVNVGIKGFCSGPMLSMIAN